MATGFSDSIKDSDFQGFTAETDILDQLGLTEYFPETLSLEDVREHDFDTASRDSREIKWVLISKLIGLNSKARDVELEPYFKENAKRTNLEQNKENSSFDNLYSSVMKQFSPVVIANVQFNPLDVLFAIFCCCSPFLKQIIISKMFICRLAVPFISSEWIHVGQPIIWLWPLRSIMIEGRSRDNAAIQEGIVKSNLKIVSFIRIGRPVVSKSKLINQVMTDQYHDTFFNKDCPYGTSTRTLSNGLIEASWFLPTRDTRDTFSDVLMFLNLRGNGVDCKTQCQILRTTSHIILVILESKVMLEQDTIDMCISLQESGVCVVYAVDCSEEDPEIVPRNIQKFMQHMKSFFKSMKFINIVNQKGVATVKEEIRDAIRYFLNGKPDTTIESMAKQIMTCSVKSDELFSDICSRGRGKTTSIIDVVQKHKKTEILPLQNPIWMELTKIEKQQRRASETFEMKQVDKLEQTKQHLRRKQHERCENMSHAITKLISTMIELEKSPDELRFFISYLKQEMDEISRVNLPNLVQHYHMKWAKWESQKGKIDPKKLNAFKIDVDKAERNLVEAPFGFEHLIREIGQIYECVKIVSPTTDTIFIRTVIQCPRLVAKQLLLGQPFEIMDGDAANVPTTWVSAVFDEIIAIVGNVKLLSISVLGIQSSGKSTLLNTMFGLQFAVSAGRCTRGVFIQLVQVPKHKYPFEYIFVIDTEGLRAPELSDLKHEHDNELATFVIGLGDVTIINVKGENTAEVNDVLQIAVHAFLRLKLTAQNNISLYQSCLFVHQNVPAKDAKEKMMHGRKKFVENLDLMTKEAAEQENMSHISSFRQVMDFDSEDHVFYFSDLWYGDPPMAPVNPGYSKNVEMMKNFLLTDIVDKRTTFLTIEDTKQRITDLWEGILTDDFVYSFRNSLEIKAYNSIETTFQSITWSLERFVFEFIFKTAENEFGSCQNRENVRRIHSQIKIKFQQVLSNKLQSLIEKWYRALEKSPWKEIVVQWKETKANRLKQIAEDYRINAEEELNTLKEKYEFEVRNKTGLTLQEEDMLFDTAKSIAEQLKGKTPTDRQIQTEFSKMWKSLIDELGRKYNQNTTSVGDQIRCSLQELYQSDAAFLKTCIRQTDCQDYSELNRLKGSIRTKDIKEGHVGVQMYPSEKSRFVISKDHARLATVQITDHILERLDVMIDEKKSSNTKFNILYVKELFKTIENDIQTHNEHKENKAPFNLQKPYQAMLLNHVGKYAEKVFTEMDERYEESNGWQRRLSDHKRHLWELFVARVNEQSEEIGAASIFIQVVNDAVSSMVSKFLPIDVQNLVLMDFAHTKFHLMMTIMDGLAETEDFEQFCSYTKDSETFAKKWISDYIEKKLFLQDKDDTMNMYSTLANTRIVKTFGFLNKAVKYACNCSAQFQENDIDSWIGCFIEGLNKELPLSASSFRQVIGRQILNVQRFGNTLLNELSDLQIRVLGTFKTVTPSTVMWIGTNPSISTFTKLWGCKAHCPFCLEPCQKADEGHIYIDKNDVHTCIQHRPAGINGAFFANSTQMSIEVCNFQVQSNCKFRCSASHYECRNSGNCNSKDNITSHPFREYKTFIPAWDIAPSTSIRSSDYWSWYLATFVGNICDRYHIKLPDIPESWKIITKQEARTSLRKALN
ncbi:interferon-induced very large GTPase 1-like [Mytilus trossulus]|uniref:interferon-induced very large GTPase 1-like n=1 Tax=Mytilus trossulus TaxID=6551 RepID=UPI00300600F0